MNGLSGSSFITLGVRAQQAETALVMTQSLTGQPLVVTADVFSPVVALENNARVC